MYFEMFHVSPNVNLPISIWLLVLNKLLFFHILKMQSIQAFMNGNNSLTLGLYRRLMTCFVHGPSAQSLSPVITPKTVINLQ